MTSWRWSSELFLDRLIQPDAQLVRDLVPTAGQPRALVQVESVTRTAVAGLICQSAENGEPFNVRARKQVESMVMGLRENLTEMLADDVEDRV
jgi:hypothetical protein